MWPLLDVVDASAATEPWCRSLAQYIGPPGDDRGRRVAICRRLSGLYDEYAQSRPEMLLAWAADADECGDGTRLDDDLRWQAELWRHLRDQIGPHPTELLDDACRALADHPERSDLPERLSVFGASRLSPSRLMVLAAIAQHRDVHVWLHHSSPALWEKVRQTPIATRRKDDRVRGRLGHPLLSSLSRDVIELQQVIAQRAAAVTHTLHDGAALPNTLLGRLKQDLAADIVRDRPPEHDPADRSVQVHACHGRTRQVEVLREVILGLLADDPTLEPRDVLVMCPDVESFAPIIAATFSLGSEAQTGHPAARLRVRLADRALHQTNPLLAVLAQLLELGTARVTASQVLDLAGAPAVRQRFGFDDDDIERLRDWTVAAGVRWGLDSEHRRAWQLGGIDQGSWHAGIDRLLLGVAMEGPSSTYGKVVPLDDVDSSDIVLAGRLAELVDRLGSAQQLMSGRHTAAEWMQGLEDAVLGLAATPYDGTWQQLQLRGELADVVDAAAGSSALLGLADVRALLEGTLAGRPTRASFRTGSLTVCTLVPMRSVPHRVVCLLGLDDGVFPRQSIRDGDDVLAREPWIGERDPRSEDRQLLLDAIAAATEHLVITYTGADERTGTPVPPAVPLGELLDALDRTATAVDGRRLRDVITSHHPLQPFDSRNFVSGVLRPGESFSFDPLSHAGALAAAGERVDPAPILTGPLPELPPRDVQLSDLHRLLAHPARGFLRQRLQVAETKTEDEPADALPVELDSLELWQVGDRVLRERLAGLEPSECIALEEHRGSLPPGPLGRTSLQSVGHTVEALLQASTQERAHEPDAADVDVTLADGTRLTGTVGELRGDVLLSLTYSQLGARQRLEAWIDLVALTVAHPDRECRAVVVGRRGARAQRTVLVAPSRKEAIETLEELVALYRSGLRGPLPMPVKSAAEYADQRNRGADIPEARRRAEQKWVTGKFPGEQADAEHVLLFGTDAPLSVLTGQRPDRGESAPGWHRDEIDRFGLLSRRVWGRLLAAETAVPS
jgi:exodeoxyribonuclease V gamma subunit